VLLLFLLPMGSRPVGLLWWHIPLIGLGKQTDLLVAGGRTTVTRLAGLKREETLGAENSI